MAQGSVEDRLAIRELIEKFAVATMHIDPELWGSTWAEDGKWKLPSLDAPVAGRENILAMFKEKLAYVDHMSMISFPYELDFEGDHARGQAYCRELIYTKEGDQKIVIGYFDDEYVKREGQWLFASRTYNVMGIH